MDLFDILLARKLVGGGGSSSGGEIPPEVLEQYITEEELQTYVLNATQSITEEELLEILN